ncbi:gliding motility lipoprotein GldD [Reichenbachiella sp. MALMAid0571]|uniref:gliding motility lipoprotein GldD n=1 Tax=Reichenbachiella sp. MALMAid0571 TaxID=3143939 RepID=UPI0032E01D8C
MIESKIYLKHALSLIFVFIVCTLVSCESEFSPKPKGYNRIELPQAVYIQLPDSFPYNFSYSAFAKITRDSSWISERYWIDLTYPELGATIQVTYKPVEKNKQNLKEYLNDSYNLTSKHNVKAYAIDEAVINLSNGGKATVMSLSGEVPSPFQFHVTDSINHFIRGALYFKTSTKNDSLAPVINYVKKDIIHMLNSLEWND